MPKGGAVAGISAGNSDKIRFAVAFLCEELSDPFLRYFYRLKMVEIAGFLSCLFLFFIILIGGNSNEKHGI